MQPFDAAVVHFGDVLIVHPAAGDVEAQHRVALRPHANGDVLPQRQLPALVIAAPIVLDALIACFQPGRMHIVPEVHWPHDGAIVLRLSLVSLPLS